MVLGLKTPRVCKDVTGGRRLGSAEFSYQLSEGLGPGFLFPYLSGV